MSLVQFPFRLLLEVSSHELSEICHFAGTRLPFVKSYKVKRDRFIEKELIL